MKKVIKSDNYVDNSADASLISGMMINDQEYCRITFVRHVLDASGFPDVGEDAQMDFYVEATQTVTMPIKALESLVKAINSSFNFDNK